MSEPPEDGERRSRALALVALVATLVAPGLILWSWSRPRIAPPAEMPTLALPPDAIRAQLDEDATSAERVPDDETTRARRALYVEANEAEIAGTDPPARARRRTERLAETLDALEEAHGEPAVAGARVADLERAEAAMRGELPEVRRAGELGGFPEALERWNMARRGRQAAPRFVVRTAFKARWNVMHGRDATEGMSEIERRAHWGWLGLHGDAASLAMRLEALDHYEEVGGERAEEARAVLLYDEGMGNEAQAAFEAAHAGQPTFRLRNHALAASVR